MAIEKLEKVDIIGLQEHEQYDFSERSSKKENIESLNGILGLTIVDISKENHVGSYRCDLFAKDEITGIKVIIENQMEMSNKNEFVKNTRGRINWKKTIKNNENNKINKSLLIEEIINIKNSEIFN